MKIFLLIIGSIFMVFAFFMGVGYFLLGGDEDLMSGAVGSIAIAGIYLSGGTIVEAIDSLGDRLKRILLDGRPR